METLSRTLSLLLVLLLFPAAVSHAQNQIFWEAFNDHRPSDLTHDNVSDYDLRITDDGGPLLDFATGDELSATVTVVVEDDAEPDDFGANNPVDEGSPADLLFAGKVDVGNAGLPGLRDSNAIKLTLVFSGLDPNKRYNFRGTVSRGNNYDDRWSVFGITGTEAWEDTHVDGGDRQNIFTEATFPDGDLEANQVALNSGHNLEGSLVAWDNIEPGDDGEFSIDSQQYVGEAPFGDPAAGPYGYGFNAIYLAEVAPAGDAALIVEEDVDGNYEFDGALGMDFVANLPIRVFQLGAFDSKSNGLEAPITVELWSRNDGGTPDNFADDVGGEILATVVIEEDEGSLDGGTRFMVLEEPIVLEPGAYSIVAWGYGGGELAYQVEGPDPSAEGLTILESDFVTFVGTARFGPSADNGKFPTTPDVGPANRFAAGSFKFGSTGDSDSDGLPDDWEQIHGFDIADPSDAAADPDGDTLSNLTEFEKGTNPKSADSDGDTLNDNVETGTGTFVDASDTGTDPTNDDSDSDGLKDNVETNTKTFVSNTDTGTDPNSSDSDGDGVRDGTEVVAGFDPNNASSVPTVIRGGGSFATTHVWTDGDIPMDLITAEELTLEPEDYETITIDTDFIHFDDNGDPPIFVEQSEPFPLWGLEGNNEGRGDREDFAIRSVGQINITQSGTITFVCNSDDGFVLRIDGEDLGEAGDRGRVNTFMPADLTAGIHDLEFIYYERGGGAGVSVYIYRSIGDAPESLDESEWQLLEATGGGAGSFQIETVKVEGDKLTITWPSAPGQTFVIEQASDPANWEEVTDGYESGGVTTTYEFELGAEPPAELYVRVRDEG